MGGKASRRKGHDFERRVAKDLRAIFPDAKRGYQTRGGTAEAPDVDGTPFFIECKNQKAPNAVAALEQAEIAAEAANDTRLCVAIVKQGRRISVWMRGWDWCVLAAKGGNTGHAALGLNDYPLSMEYGEFLRLLRELY